MPANSVVLAGAVVAESPYFEFLGERKTPFLRFYLAIPRREGRGEDHIRVVAYGKLAQESYPRLGPGTGVALTGHLQTRTHPRAGRRLILEVVAERMSFPDDPVEPVNEVFLAGVVPTMPRFDFQNGRAVLRLRLSVVRPAEENPARDLIRVVAYDQLARETYAYLRAGAEIAVLGALRVRPLPPRVSPQSVMEVIASRFTLVNVDWETGNRVREQLRQLEERGVL